MNAPRKQSRYRPTKPLSAGPPVPLPPKTFVVNDLLMRASRERLAEEQGYPSWRSYYLTELVRPGADPRSFKFIG